MAVDPKKTRKVLIVHGVQTGTDQDLHQDVEIRNLIRNRLNGISLDFETDLYRYEDINDEAQQRLRQVFSLFLNKLSTGRGQVVDLSLDLVLDVVIALDNGSTAEIIRKGLIDKILSFYEAGNPLCLVAHSLGTIYAHDAINQLIRSRQYFKRDDRKTWPVQALVTMGSPLGLAMFRRSSVQNLGSGRKIFRWINYWSRTDPVVSGSFYGRPEQGYNIVERFHSDSPDCGWFIQDRVVDMGKAWLMAHTGYWDHPAIGDDLAALVAS